MCGRENCFYGLRFRASRNELRLCGYQPRACSYEPRVFSYQPGLCRCESRLHRCEAGPRGCRLKAGWGCIRAFILKTVFGGVASETWARSVIVPRRGCLQAALTSERTKRVRFAHSFG